MKIIFAHKFFTLLKNCNHKEFYKNDSIKVTQCGSCFSFNNRKNSVNNSTSDTHLCWTNTSLQSLAGGDGEKFLEKLCQEEILHTGKSFNGKRFNIKLHALQSWSIFPHSWAWGGKSGKFPRFGGGFGGGQIPSTTFQFSEIFNCQVGRPSGGR